MNEFKWISEFDCHPFSATTWHPRNQNLYLFIFVIKCDQTFIPQTCRAIGPLKEKLNFFSPLGPKSDLDHKNSELKPHLVRASKWYLDDKNPIHSWETALIFPFSAFNISI